LNTIFRVHRNRQKIVNYHENNDKELQYVKIEFPKKSAFRVFLDQNTFEQKYYA